MNCATELNKVNCNCTYEPCERKGKCCRCISYHLAMDELPACAFPNNIEKTHDRSFKCFARMVSKES
ncbi:DUF6485 family protein [Dehalococcoides sp. THU3]|uniref:DUF6485 family protein n=1 Tax=Dehalococcoides TaxID=61434 RepID=UPI0005B57A1C|nr:MULTISPECIES: DUF6485 family protein [Dehalococcoides]QYY58256.1 DUF6485 family protein [Dehalococcoides mccartyi]BAQ34401.1 hypothetical protein UCH007_04430 [Dehalococcoides sp. UCH007]